MRELSVGGLRMQYARAGVMAARADKRGDVRAAQLWEREQRELWQMLLQRKAV